MGAFENYFIKSQGCGGGASTASLFFVQQREMIDFIDLEFGFTCKLFWFTSTSSTALHESLLKAAVGK